MNCPKCRCASRVKNGKIKNIQRYKCKSCGCNYTRSSLSRISLDKRIECIRLYLEGVGFRGIERLTGVSNVTVMRWVKRLGDDIERLRPQSGECEAVSVMENASAPCNLDGAMRWPHKGFGIS